MPKAWEQIMAFSKDDLKLIRKFLELVDSIKANPFEGIGKPEALKGDLQGFWSRRINEEHRLVYTVKKDYVVIVRVKGHYLDR